MKRAVIPIQADDCRGPVESIAAIRLTRRSLLKGAGILTGTLAVSSTLAMVAPSRVWALEMSTFDAHQGAVILAFTRHLYPHKGLEDAVYALVVKALDQKSKADPANRKTLLAGVKRLDGIAGTNWLKRSASLQAVDVASMEGDPFFELVRSTAVVSLYSNTMAYAHFGYGGEEGDGGYLHKGFNDLAWLPNPPAKDSGPIPQDS